MDVLRKADTPKSDYDALYDHSEAVLITEELIARGYGEEDLRKIIGGNLKDKNALAILGNARTFARAIENISQLEQQYEYDLEIKSASLALIQKKDL